MERLADSRGILEMLVGNFWWKDGQIDELIEEAHTAALTATAVKAAMKRS